MSRLLLHLFSILAYYLAGIVAREAIVGGLIAESQSSRFYQASLLVSAHNHVPKCGGGIINDQYILSAAHCVVANNNRLIGRPIFVLVGTSDLRVAGEIVNVTKIFIPKEYDPQIAHSVGDIAVLRLKKALVMYKYKRLYLATVARSSNYEDETVRIAGFGWNKVSEDNEVLGERSDHKLRFADVDVRTPIECKHDHPTLNLTEKHLCARVRKPHYLEKRFGVCVGDGGGPLVLSGRSVIGVLSVTTVGCSEKTSSGIYTRVSHYREFIRNSMDNIQTRFTRVL